MFAIQKGISQWGEWIISPLLLLTGGFMLWGQRLNLPKFGFSGDNEKLQNLKGGVGSLTLGILSVSYTHLCLCRIRQLQGGLPQSSGTYRTIAG